MPIYEYECKQCGKQTEAIQRLDEPPLELCPHCGGSLRKLMSAPAFQFKGSGWYVTDYANKGRKDAGDTEDRSKAKSETADAGSKTEDSAKAAKPSASEAPSTS